MKKMSFSLKIFLCLAFMLTAGAFQLAEPSAALSGILILRKVSDEHLFRRDLGV